MKNRSLFVLSLVAVLPQNLRRHVVLPRLRIKQFRERRVALRKPSHRFSRSRIRVSRPKPVQAVEVCTSEEDAVDWHSVTTDKF